MNALAATTHTRRVIRSFPASLFCGLLFALIIAFPATAQSDEEVISIESNLVVLNVTVTDEREAYVRGLKRDDFQVFEDGDAQTVTTFSVEDTPYAAAILIDTSGSMEGRMTLARAAAIRFLDNLRVDDVAAVYRFDSKVERLQDFSPSRDLAPMAYTVRAKGMTVLNDAVAQAAKELAERPEKRKAILIISDGADTQSRLSQDKALNLALTAGTTIYAVDMSADQTGSRPRPAPALKQYAAKSGGRYVPTPGGHAMREAFINIAEELSSQYTIGYQTGNRQPDGAWRKIAVQGRREGLRMRTRTGYRVAKR